VLKLWFDNRDDEDEDIEETIQKRRGRRKKKKTEKVVQKDKEVSEEVTPSQEEYEQTGQRVYCLRFFCLGIFRFPRKTDWLV